MGALLEKKIFHRRSIFPFFFFLSRDSEILHDCKDRRESSLFFRWSFGNSIANRRNECEIKERQGNEFYMVELVIYDMFSFAHNVEQTLINLK